MLRNSGLINCICFRSKLTGSAFGLFFHVQVFPCLGLAIYLYATSSLVRWSSRSHISWLTTWSKRARKWLKTGFQIRFSGHRVLWVLVRLEHEVLIPRLPDRDLREVVVPWSFLSGGRHSLFLRNVIRYGAGWWVPDFFTVEWEKIVGIAAQIANDTISPGFVTRRCERLGRAQKFGDGIYSGFHCLSSQMSKNLRECRRKLYTRSSQNEIQWTHRTP